MRRHIFLSDYPTTDNGGGGAALPDREKSPGGGPLEFITRDYFN